MKISCPELHNAPLKLQYPTSLHELAEPSARPTPLSVKFMRHHVSRMWTSPLYTTPARRQRATIQPPRALKKENPACYLLHTPPPLTASLSRRCDYPPAMWHPYSTGHVLQNVPNIKEKPISSTQTHQLRPSEGSGCQKSCILQHQHH